MKTAILARFVLGAALGFGAMSSSHATITDLGLINDGRTSITSEFFAPGQSFSDSIDFTVNGVTEIIGSFFAIGISDFQVSLAGNSESGRTAGPFTAGSYSFADLAPGSYTFNISGSAGSLGGAYFNAFGANVAAVPEADTWLMILIGLGMVAYQLRRKQRAIEPQPLAIA